VIYGVGTDIVGVARIEQALERHGPGFAQRVLGPSEWLEYKRRSQVSAPRGVLFVATRFAGKEALSKALGLGMRAPMTWHACEILPAELGQPTLRFADELQSWMQARGLRAHLSLSDEVQYAAAFAVVEQADPQ
jgi:holo-[acyl-carrier protein] synthase